MKADNICLPDADDTARTSTVTNPSETRSDISCNSRLQPADGCVEVNTSLAREPASIPSPTSRQTGNRSRDGVGQRSRIVPPRACVQRHHPRDPASADGTQVNGARNWRRLIALLLWQQPVTFAAPCSSVYIHRRRSSVNFGERHFCPKIYAWKINKMPEFYMIFARKIFFPNFGGKCPLPAPISYPYAYI